MYCKFKVMQVIFYILLIVKNGILFHIPIDTPMPEAGGDVHQ